MENKEEETPTPTSSSTTEQSPNTDADKDELDAEDLVSNAANISVLEPSNKSVIFSMLKQIKVRIAYILIGLVYEFLHLL